jgi:RND superfamily putative drug exporter
MFAALGRFVSRRPWYVIGAWVVLAVVVVSLAPTLETTSDQSEFLPDKYESIKALELQDEKFPGATTPAAILVFQREDGGKLTADDQSEIGRIAEELGPQLGTETFVPEVVVTTEGQPNLSEDGTVAAGFIGLAEESTGFDTQAIDDGRDLRDDLEPLVEDTGLEVQSTGPVPQALDSQDSGEDALRIVAIATIVLIVVLLALIFRSVIICLLPIVVVFLVSMIATGLIGWANEAFDLKADASIEQILVVVLYGVGTDYILFFLFRYRERLRQGEEKRASVVHALERAGEAIASAGGAVIVAFMVLVLSSLSIFRAIGPSLAIAVAVTLLAALTLVPAIVTLLGRALFWPSKKWKQEPEGARFARVGNGLGRRPGAFAAVSGLVLAAFAVFAFGFNASFDFNSSLPEDVESTEGIETFNEEFGAGRSELIPVVVTSDDGSTLAPEELADFRTALEGAEGVAQVGTPQPSEDGTAAQIMMTLDHDPVSDAALEDVKGPIRDAAHDAAPEGTEAYVGGTPSIFADMQEAMARDYSVVFPVAALLIMLILALLLRSLVAPLYLMAAVGLGFAATLGATVIVFQHLGGESGLIFLLPIYIYLFVTALGTDYNILMIARLREEAREGKDPHGAAAEAVKHAGPTIAAAGVILAGTFGSLMLGGNSLIVSMGFALAVGILIAAFVMSMFFTPALTALIGHAAWWPGHGDEKREPEPQPESERELPTSP